MVTFSSLLFARLNQFGAPPYCPVMRYFALLALLLCLGGGCARHQYKVTLRNDQEIAASTRPKLDKATATYHFKDAAGRKVSVSAYHIREIEIR
jgi:hypothetical protein